MPKTFDLDAIHQLYQSLRKERNKKFNRVLPFNELIVDRWEKARYVKAGEGTSIYDSCIILGNVTIGKDCWIGAYSMLDGSGDLKIGNSCGIGTCAQIYTHDGVDFNVKGKKHPIEYAPTKIGNNCNISSGAILLMGCEIGNGSVIGAGSVLLKYTKIKPNSVVVGNPARVLPNKSIRRKKK